MITASAVPGLTKHWSFEPCRVSRWERRQAIKTMFHNAHRRPEHKRIKGVRPHPIWVVYFMYSPDGDVGSSQRFTLMRLRELGLPVCIVCATPSVDQVPHTISQYCDALYWKGLAGYDFSAYALALKEISFKSPGADVFVMNDSVFGPFCDLRSIIAQAPWDLTGFTASNQVTNHIQSYAFIIRGVDKMRMAKLSTVFFPYIALSNMSAVVELQETRLARVAARSMTVGALWYGDKKDVIDPTLVRPLELLDAGFPFLKRSLLGKHASFIDPDLVRTRLRQLGHPAEDALHHGQAANASIVATVATQDELVSEEAS